MIFCSHRLWQSADNQLVRLADYRFHQFGGEQRVVHIAPVLLVPVEGRRDGTVVLTQFLVAFGSQFARKPWLLRPVVFAAAQPKAQENFPLHPKGDNVVAKRLVLGHAAKLQRVFSNLLNIHHRRQFSHATAKGTRIPTTKIRLFPQISSSIPHKKHPSR